MIAILLLVAFRLLLAIFILSRHILFRLDVKGYFIRIIWTNPDNVTLYAKDETRTQGPNDWRTEGTWVPEDNNWNGPSDNGGWEENDDWEGHDGWNQHDLDEWQQNRPQNPVATTLEEEEADERLAQFIGMGQAYGILTDGFGNEIPNQEPTADMDSTLMDE
ncbi:hypothetical protein BU15DRAFT_64252 [Melanogaster broomeanus]|nr:hypothetical protein BU15DRAFT_64252 [Melanogaster broomeanus]